MLCLCILLVTPALGIPILNELIQNITKLEQQLKHESANALKMGYIPDITFENTSLAVADFFMKVIESDSQPSIQNELIKFYQTYYTKETPEIVKQQALMVPIWEANDTIAFLLDAIDFLQQYSHSAPRLPVPSRNISNVARGVNGYYRKKNGTGSAVFGGGFSRLNHLDTIQYMHTLMDNLNVRIWNTGINPSMVQENLTVKEDVLVNIIEILDEQYLRGRGIHILISHTMPDWAIAKWPPMVGTFQQHDVNYDIDSPGVNIVLPALIKGTLKQIGCHPALRGFILANEPTFMTSNSTYTFIKYRNWLKKKYNSSIIALNIAWGTNFTTFSDIVSQPPKPIVSLDDPSPRPETVAEQWYEWNMFNNQRVTDFFQIMHDALQEFASEYGTHADCIADSIKIANNNEFGPGALNLRFKGIDRLALVEMTEINGCDTRINPGNDRPIVKNPMFYNTSIYSTDWLALAAGYTLQRSFGPTKLLFDSEFHPDSTSSYRKMKMKAQHLQTSVWMATLYGQGSNVMWYWGRDSNGKPSPSAKNGKQKSNTWFADSLMVHPGVLNAYARTMLMANAVSDKITQLATMSPRIWILISMATQTQDLWSRQTFLASFEALTFMGVQIGFVDERKLYTLETTSKNWLIVPETSHVTNNTLKFVKKYFNQTGKVLLIANMTRGKLRTLRYLPTGRQRISSAVRFVNDLPRVELGQVSVMLQQIEKTIKLQRDILCIDKKNIQNISNISNISDFTAAFGVLCRYSLNDSKIVLIIINLRSSVASIGFISSKTGKQFANAFDILQQKVVTFQSSGEIILSGQTRMFEFERKIQS